MFAEVVVDIAHTAVDRRFTYRIPEELSVSVGHHVQVPFGLGDHLKEGFVVARKETTDFRDIKDIARIIEPYPVLLQEQIRLAEWMQDAYHCLFVDALRLMIPAQLRGMRVREKKVRTIAEPRMVAMYLSRRLTKHSSTEIGEAFARNHATILYAEKQVPKLCAKNESLRMAVSQLERQLKH